METARDLLATVESKARQVAQLNVPAEPVVPPPVIVVAPAPAAAVSAPEPTKRRSHASAWVLLGTGAACAVAGGVLGAIALDNGDRTSTDPASGLIEHSLTQSQANTANTLATTGLILGSVGLAALVGSVVWLLAR
jgi:anti-sigma-K factor RskA